jgi:uncharacterized cofD-like protein
VNPRSHLSERALDLGSRPNPANIEPVHPPLRVVALGGGTGLPVVLDGLCTHAAEGGESARDRITAIVTMTDDGGSSGRLRHELGVLPPGDLRNCLVALADVSSPFRQLMQHRFEGPHALDGHPVGNLMLAAMSQITGSFPEGVERLGDMIGLRGRALPSTAENVHLRAEMDSGEVLRGETSIVKRRLRIRRLSLEPSPRPVPDVLRALVNADGIVVGPGSLYTSLLPSLLVEGIASTISGVNAVRIYVANLMTEPGETDDYTLGDHLRVIRAHTGYDLFDYILINRRPLDPQAAAQYAEQGSHPVVYHDVQECTGRGEVVECDLAVDYSGRKIRHHGGMLAGAIRALILKGRPHRVPLEPVPFGVNLPFSR